MSLFNFHLTEATVKKMAAAGLDLSGLENPAARDDAILQALRALVSAEHSEDAASSPELIPTKNARSEEFLAAVIKRLEEISQSSTLDTRTLASRVVLDMGGHEDVVRMRLIKLAHENPGLATQDGPEYRMYGKMLRGWRWHGRKPE